MKKTILPLLSLFVLVFLLLSNISCRVKETYNFLNSSEKITNISIVTLSFENDELIQTTIANIENKSTFLDDFSQIKCHVYFGDPCAATPEGTPDTVVKITYENGEYELINWNGQSTYTVERGFNYYAGFSIFDEEPFKLLISKYS